MADLDSNLYFDEAESADSRASISLLLTGKGCNVGILWPCIFLALKLLSVQLTSLIDTRGS